MKPKFNLWIENKGTVVLSEWRVRLLQAIASGGSLSAAAAKMRVPVRRAREKLAEMERGLGFELVEPDPKGQGRKPLRITARGKRLIQRFGAFQKSFDAEVARRYRAAFGR